MAASVTWWMGFILLIETLLFIDLGWLNRKSRVIAPRQAVAWTLLWVGIALFFNLGLLFGWLGGYAPGVREQKATEFFTGYLIEYALSVDNLFVFVLLFEYFRLPAQYQHRVLFWGIFGALILRGSMIVLGSALIGRFAWVLYLFGVFLIYTGVKMLVKDGGEKVDPENNPIVRGFKRFVPLTHDYVGNKFWVVQAGRRLATPLMVLLLCVEVTDLVFAVDSIPAIFAITQDPFIVFSSNVFAILGLRSLYFLLAHVMSLFHYLRYGLGVILTFIGGKMLLAHTACAIGTACSLGVVGAVLTGTVVLSLLKKRPG